MDVEAKGDDAHAGVLHNLRQTTGFRVWDLFSRVEDPRKQLLELTQDLAYRTTTVASDEAVCIAVLIDLPLGKYDT